MGRNIFLHFAFNSLMLYSLQLQLCFGVNRPGVKKSLNVYFNSGMDLQELDACCDICEIIITNVKCMND